MGTSSGPCWRPTCPAMIIKAVEEQLLRDPGTRRGRVPDEGLYRKDGGGFAWRMNVPLLEHDLSHILAAIGPETVRVPTLFIRGGQSNCIRARTCRRSRNSSRTAGWRPFVRRPLGACPGTGRSGLPDPGAAMRTAWLVAMLIPCWSTPSLRTAAGCVTRVAWTCARASTGTFSPSA